MDGSKAAIVITITLIAVVVFNLVLFAWAKRRGPKPGGQIDMFNRAFQRGKNPWGSENDKLAELSATVAELQKNKIESESQQQEE